MARRGNQHMLWALSGGVWLLALLAGTAMADDRPDTAPPELRLSLRDAIQAAIDNNVNVRVLKERIAWGRPRGRREPPHERRTLRNERRSTGEIVNAREANLIKNPHQVKANRLYDTEHAQVVHITLEPGESVKKHVTPVDVFYLLEGKEIVEIEEDSKVVGPDKLIPSLHESLTHGPTRATSRFACWSSRSRARPKPRSCCET